MSESKEDDIPLERTTRVTDALEGLRSVIDQASQVLRDLTEAGGMQAGDRAREMVQGIRSQGEQAVGGIEKQVGQKPFTSLAVAFGIGYLVGTFTRR